MKFGAHISLEKGLIGVPDRAKEVGANSIQIFSGNPRAWKNDKYKQEEAKIFLAKIKKENLGPVFLHGPYLINLASQNPYIYTNSISNLGISLLKANQIKAEGVITHLGSATGNQTRAEGVRRVVKAIKTIFKSTKGNLILENSAGAGEVIGDKIEELATIISKVNSNRLGICLDTAHLFASDYDLRKKGQLDKLIDSFDKKIGIDKLKVFHLNDSKGKLGSNLDRHADIGRGELREKAFENIVNQPRLKELSAIIETPTIEEDDSNLKLLRKLSKNNGRSQY